MPVCASCGAEMKTCDKCGGFLCTPGCTDRIDDGCTCEEEDLYEEGEEDEEEEEEE